MSLSMSWNKIQNKFWAIRLAIKPVCEKEITLFISKFKEWVFGMWLKSVCYIYKTQACTVEQNAS